MVAACVGAPRDPEMDDDLKALIEQINRNTAAQKEQTKKWRQELGLPDPEPTELELLLQKWEQAEEAWLSAAPVREAPESPAPEVLQGEQEEETVPEPEEVSTTPPPQLQTTTPEEDPALVSAVPCPLLLDTLPVFLDLPAFGLEPRNLHHQPQLCPWFPTPLSPNTLQCSDAMRSDAGSEWSFCTVKIKTDVSKSAECLQLLVVGCMFPCLQSGHKFGGVESSSTCQRAERLL
ncbi:UNVERIFIED_CONTAM: hypothetical protein FKN15_022460 [Acipenser sinensis]